MNLFKTITLKVHGLGHSGEGVGTFDGKTVFVDGALPGEEVEAIVHANHKNFAVAKLSRILKRSPFRVHPPCPYFGECGGCQLMHLAYSKQVESKRQRVLDSLERIGKLQNVEVLDCLPSPLPLHYRNKIQLPVREKEQKIEMGLYKKGSHELIQIDACLIHSEIGEAVYKRINELLPLSELSAFNPQTGKGYLRHVLIKSAFKTKSVLIVLVTNGEKNEKLKRFSQKLIQIQNVQGVIQNINTKNDNVILGKKFVTLDGISQIQETLLDLTFHISAASFFQVNPFQAENLYTKALEFAEVKKEDVVLDSYCGVGTLSLVFARHVKKVIGVECVSEAIFDAKENAKLNKIENVEFLCSLSEKALQLIEKADILLINPPRKGCDPLFLKGVLKYLPERIVYISCDPATLARDLAILEKGGYETKKVQPFDMFPQTSHVESVAKLRLKK